jgi:hypothetical protein
MKQSGSRLMNFLAQLRKTDPSSPVAYHLEGLVESQANIQSLLAKLDSLEEIDRESAAKDAPMAGGTNCKDP